MLVITDLIDRILLVHMYINADTHYRGNPWDTSVGCTINVMLWLAHVLWGVAYAGGGGRVLNHHTYTEESNRSNLE